MTGSVNKIEVGGLQVAYQRTGSGPPLVLLHGGFGLDSRSWQPQLDGLADAFTIVAWDAPGAGRSADPPPSFRLPDYADTLAALIEALDLERPHVLGLSFGAALALELYHRHRALPRSLVLVGAYAGWAGSLPPETVAERVRMWREDAQRPAAEWVPRYLPGMFGDAPPPEIVEHTATLMAATRPAGNLAMLLGLAEADLRDVLPRIDIPTLLLHGEADQRSPVGIAQDLHARIPGSELVLLAGIGHAANLEAPERFNAQVRRFLNST